MEYRVFGNDIVLRIQKGEDIPTVLQAVCEKEQVKLASVSGLGAVGEVTLGVFNTQRFAYETQTYTGDMEIASCSGNISTMDVKTYLHLHMVVANVMQGICHGGHVNRAIVSLTGEFILHRIDGQVEREYSPEVGLNLFKFVD